MLNAELSESFFVNYIQTKEIKITVKNILRKRGSGRLNQKRKERFLTALSTVIKKGPTTSIRKHSNEFKVNEITVKTAIKRGLNPDINPFHYVIWSVLEIKTNATPRPSIRSLKSAMEEEWNKTPEEFILKAFKLF